MEIISGLLRFLLRQFENALCVSLLSAASLLKFISAPISIEENVWIASKATVLKGVSIEKGSVVAGSAVVTKSIGPKEVWGGIPAKFIKMCQVHDGGNYQFKL